MAAHDPRRSFLCFFIVLSPALLLRRLWQGYYVCSACPSFPAPSSLETNTQIQILIQIQRYKCTNTNCAAPLTRILCLLRLSLFLPWDGDQHRISWDIKVYLICKYFQHVKHWIHLLHISYTCIYLIFHEDISHFMYIFIHFCFVYKIQKQK